MDIFTFMANNPWQTFFLGPFVLVVMIVSGLVFLRVTKYILRAVNVLFHGWPPEHLNADGSFKIKNEG